MSGGGSAPATPSTTTSIQDIPAWEQGYVTNLLGKAQTLSDQPYQQFQGPQVAGFTPDQTQAFSNIEGAGNANQANQAAATGQITQGANTANGIYGAGASDINSASSYNPLAAVAPYLGAATGYNSAAAAQPWLNQASGYQGAAAQAGTPQGIQNYMSPYTNSVVQGIQNEANQNWNQNIMPGVNNAFIGSGQYGSGRNAQVLGQAAGNFQTGLSANVANALQSGYNTAGTQAANQASLLSGLGSQALTGANTASGVQGAQVTNLLNQANAAGNSTQQQASNLLGQGTALGNLQSTQGAQQVAAGAALGNLGAQQANTNLTQNQALQATGQQQQQLNQSNLNTAMQNFQNQTQYPEQQTEYLNQIIRGLPAPSASTGASQTTPAYSVSPLSGIGGAGTAGLSLLGSNGQSLGTATGFKGGGLVKGYAEGGVVTAGDDEDYGDDIYNPLDSVDEENSASAPVVPTKLIDPQYNVSQPMASSPPVAAPSAPLAISEKNPLDNADAMPDDRTNGFSKADMQQQQLLALARGMLTPSLGGSGFAALGQGIGAAQDIGMQQQMWNAQQKEKAQELALRREVVQQGKYTPIKDMFGNVTGIMDTKTGKLLPMGPKDGVQSPDSTMTDEEPSADPQKAAMQILNETGTPFTPIGSRQDITGRNAQAKAYRDAASGAKKAIQEMNSLNAQTGKYTPGSTAGWIYGKESANSLGGSGATARTEADKASKNLANSLMNATAGAKGSGIRMVEFDAGAVPNADMTDEARTDLINKNKAIANQQIQRAAISDMYPRMHLSNVNAIMDNYEAKNPPVLDNGKPNPNWMPYKDWLAKGRPNTSAMTTTPDDSSTNKNPMATGQPTLADLLAEKNLRKQRKQQQ